MCDLCEKNRNDIQQDIDVLTDVYEKALDFLDRDEASVRCPAVTSAIQHIVSIHHENLVTAYILDAPEEALRSEAVAFSLAFLWGYFYRDKRNILMNWTDVDIAAYQNEHLIEEIEKELNKERKGPIDE